jgi:hypothetical protein
MIMRRHVLTVFVSFVSISFDDDNEESHLYAYRRGVYQHVFVDIGEGVAQRCIFGANESVEGTQV